MKNLKYLFLLFIFTGLSYSCTDDLNIIPEDDQTSISEETFEDEGAYKEVLSGIYANLALTGIDGAESSNIQGLDAGTSQFGRVWFYLQDLAADQFIWSYENDGGVREIQRNIWNPQNPLVTGMYGRSHVTIAFANNFLRETTPEKLDARNVSSGTRANIATYRAEAKLLRALSYYTLLDVFRKASFVTEDDPVTNYYPPQIEGQDLFNYVETELLAVEGELLEPGSNEHGRADKAVAWMILSKLYLNAEVYIGTQRYADVITQTNKLLNQSAYSLADNYLEIFMADNDSNGGSSEIIFPLISDGSNVQNYGPTTVIINGCVGSIEANGDEVGVGSSGWGGAIRLRKQFSNLFAGSAFSSDTRNTLITASRDIEITDISDKDQGYILQKYSNAKSSGGFGSNQTFVDTDFPFFRLADAYLMYAEAVLRGGGGDMNTAVNLVNQLRTRANNPNQISSSTLTLDFILDERARELHFEGHRRQDLVRFGKFTGGSYNWVWKGNGSNGISLPNYMNVYPIPASSLASNPNLTQNAGY